MRWLLVVASILTVTAQQKWTVVLFDNFNIEDGPPGKDWVAVNSSEVPGGMPQVFSHQLCGTTQSVALFANVGPMQADSRITYIFQSATNAGFETYLVATKAGNVSDETLLVGCDGGYTGQGFCSPTIQTFTVSYAKGVPQALSPHTMYRIQIVFSMKTNLVQWSLSNSFGEALYQISGTVTDLKTFTQGGLLVGRRGVTCADDFRVETLQ